MRRNIAETIMGAAVLVVAAIFFYIFYSTTQIRTVSGYNLDATFLKIGGLRTGSDVRIAGIKVGTVAAQHLDPETFEAVISLSIRSDVKIPVDTVASIASEGMLGGKYVRLKPGHEKSFIEPGGHIEKTEDFRSLEDQVGEILFLATKAPSGSDGL